VSCGKNHSVILATDIYTSADQIDLKHKDNDVDKKQPLHVGEVFVMGEAKKLGVKLETMLPISKNQQEPSSAVLLKRIGLENEGPSSHLSANIILTFPNQNPKIQMISCGSTFSLALDVIGIMYAWGDGSSGALGTGTYQDEIEPVRVKFDVSFKIKFINAGYFHAAAISEKGQLYTWGIGSEGQLGNKSNINTNSPKKVDFFDAGEAAFVSCGMYHTSCIDEKGFLYTWGGNKNGQLGQGDYDDRNSPAMVKFFKNFSVIYVNCGSNTTFVITDEGKIFSFGSNLNGKLAGVGVLENELMQSNTFPSPIDCKLSINRLMELSDEKEAMNTARVYQIATSNQFCLALTNKGQVITWGNNNNGCLARNHEVFH